MEPATWLRDPSHYPEQMTPLSATVWFEAVGLGLHDAARTLAAPFGGFRTRTELGWAYEGELDPEWEHDPRVLREAALTLPARWADTYRPRTWAITHELWEHRPELPPPTEAALLFDRMWELVREQWTLHFLVVLPAQFAAELFRDRYVELYGDGDPLAPYRLLETPHADEAIDVLARRARELHVDHLVRDLAVEHALARLGESSPGRRWLRELGGYLDPVDGVGGRSRWHELSLTREAELPQLTLEAIRLALAGGGPAAPQSTAEPVPAELAELHAACAPAFELKESHTAHIDYPGLLATREVLLGFGRRLAAEGALDATGDVWLLPRTVLRAALTEELDLRAIVAEQRAELARGLAEGPKPYLGEPPQDAERHATLEKFYGSGGRALAGAGASAGIAEGVARVVASADDFARVSTGEILVTATTTPAWTPLFRSLGGLVTETGGILSHAAVVARESGLPAVVGAAGACSAIPDGARVRIDGTSGAIQLL
jgi:phosphohistidine swiveling domain-containing protein